MDKDLVWALKNGDLDAVKDLLAKLPTEDRPQLTSAETMFRIVGNRIKTGFVEDEDVNRTLEGGRKPLHYAADGGHIETLEFLLSLGADINASDKYGITPLLSATYEGHLECVRLLVSKGADKEKKGPDGKKAVEVTECADIKALLK